MLSRHARRKLDLKFYFRRNVERLREPNYRCVTFCVMLQKKDYLFYLKPEDQLNNI